MKNAVFSSFVILALFGSVLTSTAQAQTKFDSESEAGAVIVSGNAETESYSLKTKNTYTVDKDTATAFGRYLRTRSSGTESARNWEAGLRYERSLVEQFSGFIGHKAESDPYAGYVQRDSSDLGGKYYFIKSDEFNVLSELGYRYQATLSPTGEKSYANLARLYFEINKVLTQTTSFKYWAEYLPNFTQNEAYLANTEASLSVMLSQSFSLKLSYLVQYQNVKPINTTVTPPVEGKRIDTTYTTAIVAKF